MKNKYTVLGDKVVIELPSRSGMLKCTIISLSDLELVSSYEGTWCVHLKDNGTMYAIARGGIKLHRFVTNAPEDKVVDHRDGNGLNNTRNNLRVCTQAENLQNRNKYSTNKSGHKGVAWYKPYGKWRATIGIKGKQKHLGYFDNIEDAIEARRVAEEKYHPFHK
jgi:hypothetical protein